jgi:hypothetical protein
MAEENKASRRNRQDGEAKVGLQSPNSGIDGAKQASGADFHS